ncbi:hypothetical protein HYH03_011935 [Edaphochlamys debaryana]|uniref:Inositol hexakisphosphate and diphosphoinositol-pentakisphosphate kinase n=1 Tax=Edaphochlamys debaryana TaxID=47281 RepID=A0A836BV41_9CHLO|nr:hypothetical protein HYH03_011935 [Edaphochlamys debaryana]|eukprot:KAG2489657.1 hypothetical protein HYH03_011935 [Edaphochlamys debaryana]
MRRLFKGLFRSNAEQNLPKIKVGVCAMDKKARSKPMKEILERLTAWGEFEVIIFGDDVILEKPTDEWPHVECLLCWHSDGFPLKKAQEYILNRRPFLVNDVFMQDALLDRRRVYKLLVEKNIPVPTHIIVEREGLSSGFTDPPGFVEDEDYVELNGQRIYKPFVEKPVSGEDHNIWVYYPHSMGGGVKYLFRKVDDKASKYDSEHDGRVRRDGSYIYEEFLPTGGTDVKVYTVGPRYAHAEARKSPVVDGKVLRSADGKEMRFPVLLSPQEKEIARMVCLAFGQKVCGFDLLRSEKGRSYVCDVNGWSFVKNSKKYYDDAAGILRSVLLSALAPHRLNAQPHLPATSSATNPDTGSAVVSDDEDDDALVPGMDVSEVRHTAKRSQKEELRCVLAVIRHGDRTPKQKLKVAVTQEPLLALFHRHKDAKGKQAKLKSPLQLQELLDITRQLVKDFERSEESGAPPLGDEEKEAAQEVRGKLRIIQTVLESGGQFSGINRKVQIKPLRWALAPESSQSGGAGGLTGMASEGGSAGGMAGGGGSMDVGLMAMEGSSSQVMVNSSSLQGLGSAGGAAGGAGGSEGRPPHQPPVLEEALLILKWGGVLTHAGRQQAEDLGKIYRMVMYPSGGNGLLRLHSTYRHDLKIYSSDEGRVQTSAAAFTKAMLDLEGSSLTPILVSLVNKDASMLEAFGKGASDEIAEAKEMLYQAMTWDPEKPLQAPLAVSKLNHTPMISPPLSPKVSRASSFLTASGVAAANAAAAASAAGSAPGTASGAAPGAAANATPATISSPMPGGGGSLQPTLSGEVGAGGLAATASSVYALPVLQKMMDRLAALKSAAKERLAEYEREKEAEVAAAAMAAAAVAAVVAAAEGEEAAAAAVAAEGAAVAAVKHDGPLPPSRDEPADPAEAAGADGAVASPAAAAAAALEAAEASADVAATAAAEVAEAVVTEAVTAAAAALDGPAAAAAAAAPTAAAATSIGLASQPSAHPTGVPPLPPKHSGGAAAATAAAAAGPHASGGALSHGAPRPSPLSKRSVEPGNAAFLSVTAQHTLLRNGSAKTAAIIAGLPDTPLGLLRRMVELLKQLEDRLRQLVREEGDKWRAGGGPSKYSSLSMDPKERVHEEGQPCGGEKMLLMFDRWHKLLKSFHNGKKDRFDISKVPDIYDSAKYDAIHNAHLGLDVLEELYIVAKLLADVVIPCEYGLDPGGKLRIGSKIANELLGKLLVDLASMREESMATACMEPGHGARGGTGTPSYGGFNYDQLEGELGRISLQDEAMMKHSHGLRQGPASAVSSSRGGGGGGSGPQGREGEADGDGGSAGGGQLEAAETETIHRLCPTYASDINSPLRHVRTRIYYTSESHMHSLVNCLRWCHLGVEAAEADCGGGQPPPTPPSGTGGTSSPDLRGSLGGIGGSVGVGGSSAGADGGLSPLSMAAAAAAAGSAAAPRRQFDNSPLLSERACGQLDDTTELDYLTQVVFRMYENKTVPVDAPERFRVEVLFSPGANYNPFDFTMPLHNNHVLPTIPRTALHKADGITLAEMEEKLTPFAQTRKFNTCSYALQYSLRAPHLTHGSRYGSGGNLGHHGLGHNARSTASLPGNSDSQNDLSSKVQAAGAAAGGLPTVTSVTATAPAPAAATAAAPAAGEGAATAKAEVAAAAGAVAANPPA